ncbi:MAG: phosphate/phosphite/phosphonate ABC transporter substrate-binding protein [Planctomycetes bacterium]|nr:phosphate/phosphite/phosphonate ABC transporter substrate-binding protein [Planctomycetota bacterium]
MPRETLRYAGFLMLTVLLATTGCRSAGLRLLNLIGIKKDPIMVLFVLDDEHEPPKDIREWINPAAPYEPLLAAMERELGRPVGYDMCFSFQLAPCLNTGLSHLAVVSASQYVEVLDHGEFEVLAVAIDDKGRSARSALLVVPAESGIRGLDDLRKKRIAFGPNGDARTHHAAWKLLREHGLDKTDLALELLPLPGSLKHMPHMRAIAQSVINHSSDAGFVDEGAWEAFPESDPREGEPARDKLRVVARTVAVPNQLILRSPKLDDPGAKSVRAFLMSVGAKSPEALDALPNAGYGPASAELLALCREVVTAAPKGAAEKP